MVVRLDVRSPSTALFRAYVQCNMFSVTPFLHNIRRLDRFCMVLSCFSSSALCLGH